MKNICVFLFFIIAVRCLNSQLKKAEKSELKLCFDKFYIQSFDNSYLNLSGSEIGLVKIPNLKKEISDLSYNKESTLFTFNKVDANRITITANNKENLMLKNDSLIKEDLHDKITLVKVQNEKNEVFYKIRFENNECLVNYEDRIRATNCDLINDFSYGKIHQGLYFKLIPKEQESKEENKFNKKEDCLLY